MAKIIGKAIAKKDISIRVLSMCGQRHYITINTGQRLPYIEGRSCKYIELDTPHIALSTVPSEYHKDFDILLNA